ncbi:unnamed protein product, partial [Prorocentrum cordatum]
MQGTSCQMCGVAVGPLIPVESILGGAVMKKNESMDPEIGTVLMFLSLLGSVATMVVFWCCPQVMRLSPTNYILLGVFTFAKSVMVGFICSQYSEESVLVVLGLACFIQAGLTAFTVQKKCDFIGFASYLMCGSLVMLGMSFGLIFGSIFGLSGAAFQTARLCMCGLGALLLATYIVYDTQMILGNKHPNHKFSVDEYAAAAIMLYIDIIVQLFLYLLELLGDRRDSRNRGVRGARARFQPVLHLDRNSYYGGDCASLNITNLWEKFRPGTAPPKELGANRDWNVDLIPKFIMASGDLVKILLKTKVSRYLEWKSCDRSYVYQPQEAGLFSGAKYIHSVPTTAQ